jgi:hypothetical protein
LHVVAAGVLIVAGLHVRDSPVAVEDDIAICAPAPVTGIPPPAGVAALLFVREIRVAEPEDVPDSFTLIDATTPLVMTFSFMPLTTHTIDPVRGLHCTAFRAAVAAGPADALTATTSDVL